MNRDRGSASLWLLGVGLGVVLLGVMAATVASAVVARHRAQAAADLGALAGAARAAQGEAVACARAAELVRANRARLVGCRLDGLDLVVTAAVGPARATARAGPVRADAPASVGGGRAGPRDARAGLPGETRNNGPIRAERRSVRLLTPAPAGQVPEPGGSRAEQGRTRRPLGLSVVRCPQGRHNVHPI